MFHAAQIMLVVPGKEEQCGLLLSSCVEAAMMLPSALVSKLDFSRLLTLYWPDRPRGKLN